MREKLAVLTSYALKLMGLLISSSLGKKHLRFCSVLIMIIAQWDLIDLLCPLPLKSHWFLTASSISAI